MMHEQDIQGTCRAPGQMHQPCLIEGLSHEALAPLTRHPLDTHIQPDLRRGDLPAAYALWCDQRPARFLR